jgi:hypothetical protein
MEVNVEEVKVIRISKQKSTVQVLIRLQQLGNVEYFEYSVA